MIFFNYKNRIATFTLFMLLGTTLFHTTQTNAFSSDEAITRDIQAKSDDMLDDDLDALLDSITPEDLIKLRSCEPLEAKAWLDILTQVVNLPVVFDQDFYKKTSIPIARNLINYPDFLLCSYQKPSSNNQLTTHVFYNITPLKAFTQDPVNSPYKEVGTRIGSYLNIENGALIDLIDQAFNSGLVPPALAPLRGVNFPNLLRTIGNARLEERRMGLFFHYYQQVHPRTFLEIKLPFLWMIRNLNFTPAEKQVIADELSFFTGNSCVDELTFAKQHIIMDALGTGTLELSLCTRIYEQGTWGFDGGGCIYLPTDYHWAEGLYGTYIHPRNQNPILDLCSLVDVSTLTVNPKAKGIVGNYALAALDHLSSALLQCPLGYYKHLGAGLKLNPYWQIREDLEYKGQYILEFFLAQNEKRFFIDKPSTVTFSESFKKILADSSISDNDKLLILEEELTKWLFPRVFSTKVLPGIIFNSTTTLQKTYRRWDFTIGYNAWYRLEEHFVSISAPAAIVKNLDIQKSINPTAWAVKLFAKIHRDFNGPRHDVSLSLYGDATLFNQGIGNDLLFGVSFDTKF